MWTVECLTRGPSDLDLIRTRDRIHESSGGGTLVLVLTCNHADNSLLPGLVRLVSVALPLVSVAFHQANSAPPPNMLNGSGEVIGGRETPGNKAAAAAAAVYDSQQQEEEEDV
ncbi:hypothetical protein F2P81_022937 [Scophthalmus maximus]|uniref:Uncharacterized protein n=1 Tax=Scophthalmus maximus TaxID=52904 RepID=A0A6A4RV88_SCOMX|nr:hypothetical protein F2P81_022937 [Scophthalmus maximus]